MTARAIAFLACGITAAAQGNSDDVRTLNNRVLQLHGAVQRAANAAEVAQIRSQAAPIIAERAAALTALIRQNPGAALSLAFPRELRDDLAAKFPSSAAQFEQHGTWTGASDHLVFDDPARSVRRYQVSVRAGNETLEIYSAKSEPGCVSGQQLTSTGVRVNNVVAAGNTSVSSAVAAAGCSTLGVQNTAVILIQFPGYPLPSNVTPQSVSDIFFANTGKSVNTYWKEASYNQASASGQVFGPYSLNTVYTCDQYSQMRTAAIAAADAQVNFTQFSRVFIVFPSPGGCSWAGLGTLGCGSIATADGTIQASTSWLLATYMGGVDNGVKLATHEGGHNLGLHHASSRDYGAEALGAPAATGTLNEYGDPHSTMGSWNLGHYAAPHKAQIGWLPASNITTVETTGSHSVMPFETTGLGVQALKIRRGTGGTSYLWLEYRQPIGLFDSTLTAQIFGGGLVHLQDSTTGTFTHLLDYTPATTAFTDAALTGAWTDPYTNLGVAVTGANSSALSVNVNYGALTCDSRVQPTVTISPVNPQVMAGTTYGFTVSVTNHDSLGCGSSVFNLSSLLPDGVTTTFTASTLTVSPGQTLSTTMQKAVPTTYLPGTYALNAIVTSPNHNVTATGNMTVIATTCANVAPTITLSPAAVSVLRGASQNFTVAVTNNDVSPCGPRTFNLSRTLPANWTGNLSASSLTLNAGAAGSATLAVSVPADASFGANTLSAAAADALHTRSASATATVVEPISASLTVSATTIAVRGTVTLTATVTKQGGGPAANASVSFAVTRSNGSVTTATATANANGVAVVNYRAQQKGSYTARATATSAGASTTSNTVSFIAQ